MRKPEVKEVQVIDPILVKKLDGSIRTLQQAGTHLIQVAAQLETALAAAKGNIVPISRGRRNE